MPNANQKQVILVKQTDSPLPPDVVTTVLREGGQPVSVIIAMTIFVYILLRKR